MSLRRFLLLSLLFVASTAPLPAQLPADNAYIRWARARFGDAVVADPAQKDSVWGESADPDGDNLLNLVEYLSDTDPLAKTPASSSFFYSVTPAVGLSGRRGQITAWQRTDDPDLHVVVQTSPDMLNWWPPAPVDFANPLPMNAAVTTAETGATSRGLRQMRYQDVQDATSRPAAFMRLFVVRGTARVAGPGLEPFSFTFNESVAPGAVVQSNTVIVQGFSGTLTISIPATNPQVLRIYVNGVLQPGTSAVVRSGDAVWLEATAPSGPAVSRNYTLTAGSFSATWQFTTAATGTVADQPGVASGYTPVEAGVSETGAAQVSIPIFVSPGVAGMQPKLAITYSSQAGNGPLGLGFSLSGLSAVSRTGATLAQDGFKSAVSFSATDRFAMDGHRLIAISGADGTDGAEYRPEMDPSSRVRSYGVEGTHGPQRWVVETKAGLKSQYGVSPNTRVKGEGANSAVIWALESVTDTLGNAMNVTYDEVARQRGEVLVTRIAYTANVGQSLTAAQEVVFEYEDRYAIFEAPARMTDWPDKTPQTVIFRLTAASGSYPTIYGTDIYTADSPLAATAVHAGALNPGETALVEVTIRPNQSSFTGSTRNGVTSTSYNGTFACYSIARSAVPANAAADPRTAYVGGFAMKMQKRLKAIESRALDGAVMKLVRRYDLSFIKDAINDDSKLASVQETLANGSQLPPTTFSWPASAPSTFLPSGSYAGFSIRDRVTPNFIGDFNGDGRTDYLNWHEPLQNNQYNLILATAGGFAAPIPTGLNPDNAVPLIIADFNGDGLADVLVYKGSRSRFDLRLSNGAGFGPPIQTDVPEFHDAFHQVLAGDFNGDGRTDILVYNNATGVKKYDLYLATGNGFAAPITTNVTSDGNAAIPRDLVFTGEFNGDGKTDLIVTNLSTGKYDLYLSTGSGFSAPIPTQVENYANAYAPNMVGDFNGDGLTDVLSYDNPGSRGGKFRLYAGTGAGFRGPIPTSIIGGEDGAGVKYNQTVDFNGDGRMDVITWHNPYANFKLNIFISCGETFKPAVVTGVDYYDILHEPGDFDGDGKTDLLCYNTPTGGQMNRFMNTGPALPLLDSVTNGHGRSTKFAYKPITNASVHTKGTGLVYPSCDLQASLYVVSELRSRNGIDGDPFTGAGSSSFGEHVITYKYEGAWTSLTGRGFQGFRAVESTDETAQIITRTEYESSTPLLGGRPRRATQRLVTAPVNGSALISETDTTWVVETVPNGGGPNRYQIHEGKSTSKAYETNRASLSALLKTVTRGGPAAGGTILYDAYDNVVQMTTTTTVPGAVSEVYTETVVNTYVDAPTPTQWHLGRLATSAVTKTAPDPAGSGTVSTTRSSAFTYHPTTGLLTQEVIEPAGGALRQQKDYVHDALGNISTSTLSTQDSAPRTTTTFYTTDGRFVRETRNALGHSETKEYDPILGTVLAQTGPNGLRTEWDYDALGRPIVERRPDGTVSRSFYRLVTGPTAGAPPRAVHFVRVQSTGGAPRTVWYDLLDREIRSDAVGFDGGGAEAGASGTTISVYKVYNARGEVIQASQPYFAGQTALYSVMVYDAVGRETEQTDPGLRITKTTYDGFLTRVERTAGSVGSSYFQRAETLVNAMGWTVSSSQFLDANAKTVTRRYDAYGNLRFVRDLLGNETELRYDVRGNKVWMSEPNAGISTFVYNGFSELLSQQNAAGEVTALAYDVLGRAITRTEREGTTSFTFDTSPRGIGLLAREEMRPPATAERGNQPDFSRSYFYDALSRPRSTIQQHGGDRFATSRGYDANGRPATMTFPTGFAVRQNYTALGHLRSVESTSGNTTYWTATLANARGQVERESLGNGIVTDRTFEPETGLIASIRSTFKGSGGVQDLAFGFDLIGNLKQRRDQRFNTPFDETFTYDTLNRLKNVETSGALPVTAQYDDIGNLRARTDVGVFAYGNGAGPHALTAINNSPGGVYNKTCTYDNKGNRVTDGATALSYSSFNKPTRIKKGSDTLTFDYGSDRAVYRQSIFRVDAQNRETQNVRHYVGGMYEREVDSVGGVRHIHYIAGGNGVVAIKTDESNATAPLTGKTRFIHKDHLGSVDVISNENGGVLERHSFDAWGRRRTLEYDGSGNWLVSYPTNPAASAGETHRGFTGHEMLDLVGLVHMGGRVYDPLTARFLSPDPFVQSPDNLQNLNRYSYVLNNPLSMTDPSGFFFKALAKIFRKIARPLQILSTVLYFVPGLQAVAFYLQVGVAFGSAFSGTLLSGGSVADALKAGLKAGAIAYGTGRLLGDLSESRGWSGAKFAEYKGLEFAKKLAEKTLAHGVIGGGANFLSGGSLSHGFLTSAAAAAASPSLFEITHDLPFGDVLGTAGAAAIGGTVSKLGGGKFSNGAISGAMGYALNTLEAKPDWLDRQLYRGGMWIARTLGMSASDANNVATFGKEMSAWAGGAKHGIVHNTVGNVDDLFMTNYAERVDDWLGLGRFNQDSVSFRSGHIFGAVVVIDIGFLVDRGMSSAPGFGRNLFSSPKPRKFYWPPDDIQ